MKIERRCGARLVRRWLQCFDEELLLSRGCRLRVAKGSLSTVKSRFVFASLGIHAVEGRF